MDNRSEDIKSESPNFIVNINLREIHVRIYQIQFTCALLVHACQKITRSDFWNVCVRAYSIPDKIIIYATIMQYTAFFQLEKVPVFFIFICYRIKSCNFY